MKTTVRIVTLALALGLAGALTAAWGAQSVVELIKQGESVIGAVNSAKVDRDALLQKNSSLAAEGKQIVAEQQQLQADIAAFQKASDEFNKKATDYQSKCKKPPTTDAFNACKAEHAQLIDESTNLKTEPAKLNKRESDLNTKAVKYNQETQVIPKQVRAADDKYRNTLPALENWNTAARTMVASAAFQPYAKKAGCPNVMKPPKTVDAEITMSNEILACLKKVASMN
ncbi:MAG: hypothetical protein ACRESX_02080 [Gammaproteobacteria bacterium]